MPYSQRSVISKKLAIQAICATLLVRLTLLAVQRAAGINWDFHPDALYYINHIDSLRTNGLDTLLSERGIENAFFIIAGYCTSLLFLNTLSDTTTLITLNIILSCLTALKIIEITHTCSQRTFSAPLVFFIASPYLAHISIHPLKDSLTIYLTVSLLALLITKKTVKASMTSALLIMTRSYLGALTSIVLALWVTTTKITKSKKSLTAIYLIFALAFYLVTRTQLTERISVEFDGRDFYANGFALVPSNPEARFFLGWLFNFAVPFPYIPKSIGEAGYFLHWIFFSTLAAIGITKYLRNSTPQVFGLILSSLLLLSFILTTTPSAGPLVRYRLSTELLFLIALFTPNILKR